ncbi:heterokaryon incompatibility protein-domain-containing protein [Hyaloscypha finlandica]|nr:heterokaryon incompatibility protein-domain-containing protein [Hyaloscypha finlandica]
MYPYSTLSAAAKEIRLLTLMPGSGNDSIEGSLSTESLQSGPIYEALSYVWGSADNKPNLIIDGVTFAVTQNLHAALKRLRQQHQSRLLWVDAICINQDDTSEKSFQVAMMSEIYSKTIKGLLWLGEESQIPSWSVLPPPAPDHNDAVFHAFCLFRLLSAGHHLKDIPYFQLEEEGQETYRTFGRRAAHWICTRDWWGRIWTVQECVLPDDCTVIYGPVTASWSMFLDAIASFQHHRSSCCAGIHTAAEIYDMLNYQVDTILELRAIRDQRRRGEEILLGELVRQFRYRQATDPRDKLYALIPLVTSWNGLPPLEPHYEKSFAPVDAFRQGVIKAIEVSRTLDILCQLETPVSKANTPPPSWIPDFAQKAAHPGTLDHFMKQIHLYNACGGVMATPKVAADSVLVLEGYCVDALKRASTMMVDIKHQDRMETLSWWHQVAEEECGKANEGWRRSFWRTICGDSILRERPVGAIHYAISVTTRDKRFIVSTKGRMGVAPKMALVTIPTPDEIFILAGGKTPFVLRPAGLRDVPGTTGMQPCYTLIGDCYLEGIMDGEAMAEYSANKKPVYLV